MSASSWTLAAIALISLLLMTVAAVVEGSAGMITRERFRQTPHPRERSLQAFLDPRRSLVAALHLAQVVAVAVATSALTLMTLQEPWFDPAVVAINIIAVVFLIIGQTLPRALLRTHPELSAGALLGFGEDAEVHVVHGSHFRAAVRVGYAARYMGQMAGPFRGRTTSSTMVNP